MFFTDLFHSSNHVLLRNGKKVRTTYDDLELHYNIIEKKLVRMITYTPHKEYPFLTSIFPSIATRLFNEVLLLITI